MLPGPHRSPTTDRALRRLEYDSILLMVADHAGSAAGSQAVMALRPEWDPQGTARLRGETACAAGLIELDARPAAGFLDEAMSVLSGLDAGALILEPAELRAIGKAQEDISGFISGIRTLGEAPDTTPLRPFLESVPDLADMTDHLMSITTPDGELSPDASPELARLSRTCGRLRRRLAARIEKIAARYAGRSILRDSPPSLREGRFVLPVISSRRREMKGIVHDRSDSGETVFMEPSELVEDGNSLRESLLELDLEKRRILRDASTMVRESSADLSRGFQAAALLDAIFARAGFHLANGTVFPEEGPFALLGLEHPLISSEEVVASDVRLPLDWKVLVISGPNAGGKSVLLKAVGLAAACGQSGLGASVSAGSTIPVFRRLFVSMGDMQSIAEHRSTYSARLSEQLEMLGESTSGDLALIDEPAAGTDPLTGAALAAAFLEELAGSGCRMVVTTHMGQLKTLARGRQGFLNGCMNFQEDTIEPDYTFTAGSPGSSFTLEIAGRMDFPGELLRRAAELAGDSFRLDRLLGEISRSRSELEDRLEEVALESERNRARMSELEEALESERRALEISRRETERKASESADLLNSRADALLARLARSTDPEQRRDLRASVRELASDAKGEPLPETEPEAGGLELEKGSWVTVDGWEGSGVVERLGRNYAVVVIGNIRLRRPLSDLEPAAPPAQGGSSADWSFPVEAPSEIDLRGMSAEEARSEVDRCMDDCIIAGMSRLSVIHGKGRGILMQAVIELVKRDPRVVSFRQGMPAEGGTGITVITLKLPGKTSR